MRSSSCLYTDDFEKLPGGDSKDCHALAIAAPK